MKDVSHRNWLAGTVHPPWRHHHRLALDEVAQNLKRCGTRANDRTRPQNRDRCRARSERTLHFEPRGQPWPRIFAGLRKPAEIEDPFAPGSCYGIRKRAGELPGATWRFRILSQHRVRQVIRRPTAVRMFNEPVRVSQVAADDLYPGLGGPASRLQLLWTASQTPYPIASLQKARHQAAADVARGTGHEDRHRTISRAHGPHHGRPIP